MISPSDYQKKTRLYWILWSGVVLSTVFLMLVFLLLTSGCVTAVKQIVTPTTAPTPSPTPTEIPTTEPTPTPEPTPDYTGCGIMDNCYHLKEWHYWFRENANNFGDDLYTQATVYNYKILPNYHYHDPMWGSRSYFKESPETGNRFLFVFINIFSEGPDDPRQFGYPKHKFLVQIKNTVYYPEEDQKEENRIQELDDLWDYAHVQSPGAWGYKRVQEAGTGIIHAIQQEYIQTGRSNAWDGYIIYQIPSDTNLDELKIAASFDNLGGNAYWKLV